MAIQLALATTPMTIKGYIYASSWFEFYFNGNLIKTDPLTFTPNQAVEVEFEWDGVSDRQYAFKASNWPHPSGYIYPSTTNAQLEKGAFIAWFNDGSKTNGDWKIFTTKFGPTDASINNGCSQSDTTNCQVQSYFEPADWTKSSFDDSPWSKVTTYTEDQTGWGVSPNWLYNNFGFCGQSTSPFTGEDLEFITGNVFANETAVKVKIDPRDCLDPHD